MSTLQISLPDEVKLFLDEQVSRSGFGTADEYVCALLRRELEADRSASLRGSLQAGLDSGHPLAVDESFWQQRDDVLSTAETGK